MSVPKAIRWKVDPHTIAKHQILRKYLDAWFPIMMSFNKRIVYIDAFAGPGEYADGQPGSPIVALAAARGHGEKLKGKIAFWFIEQKPKRVANLQRCIDALKLPAHFDVNINQGTFAEDLASVLDELDADKVRLAPTFALVDPFGFARIPFAIIRRLLEQRRCEVLINIMVDSMNRFLSHPDERIRAAITEAFGTDEAIRIALGRGNRIGELRDLYLRQLKGTAKFVRYFEMRNDKNRIIYYLFFASNDAMGHEKMKEAMWRVDPTGDFTFSDATNTKQHLLFVEEPSMVPLANALAEKFGSAQAIPVALVETYVSVETPYLRKHMAAALKQLEKEERLTVAQKKMDGKPRRANTFPKDAIVTFPTK